MRLERTLTVRWVLLARDVPALRGTARDRAIVVDDVELLCASIVVDQSHSDAPYVPHELVDLYEALAFLLGRAFEVLARYDPTRGRRIHDPWTGGFKGWLHDELTCDLIDHWRSWNGRNGQKRVADPRRTEEDDGAWCDDSGDGRSLRERRSRGALAEAAGDCGDSGLDALRRRLLEGGDRALLREVEALGLSAAAGARGGATRPDRTAARLGVAA